MSSSKLKKPLVRRKTLKTTKRIPLSTQNVPCFIRHGIGLDVHKDSVAVCVSGQLPSGEIIERKHHTFKNDPVGLEEMCRFLQNFTENPTFLMECTGVYHIAVYQALCDHFSQYRKQIIAMNPLLVHNRITDLGNKNDRADARTMSSLAFYSAILKPSYVGSTYFFMLRDLVRSYHKNLSQVNRLKNRIHRILHLANQKFPFQLSTEWSLHLLDHYISKPCSLEDAFNDYLKELKDAGKGKILERHEEEILRNGSVVLTNGQRFSLQMDLLRLFSLQEAGTVFLTRAESLVLKNSELQGHYKHLFQIPGFGAITALTVITEIGDYSRFDTSKAFVKFCGVIPTVMQSGEMKSKGHVNRFTNKYLRYALTQAGGVLIGKKNRTTDLGDFAYRQYYIRNLPFKKAMLKVAQKMARIVYGILTEKRQYNPTLEFTRKAEARVQKCLAKNNSLLVSSQTRALQRNIQTFLVSHSEYLNKTSMYHLTLGFKRLIKKAEHMDREDLNPNDDLKNVNKK